MPNIAVMKSSNFLKKEDVGDGVTVTISHVSQENVAKQGAPEELRWCIHFQEFDKPMVCNATNSQLIAKFCGSEETDDWSGRQVILYDDPSVSYAGKLTGGIRVRAVPKASAAPAARQPVPVAGPVSNKAILKQKFKAHPEFNKSLMPKAVNEYCINRWGAKLDEMDEAAAQEALDVFQEIVNAAIDEIPF